MLSLSKTGVVASEFAREETVFEVPVSVAAGVSGVAAGVSTPVSVDDEPVVAAIESVEASADVFQYLNLNLAIASFLSRSSKVKVTFLSPFSALIFWKISTGCASTTFSVRAASFVVVFPRLLVSLTLIG